jgi:hypothetical protein
MTITVCVVNYTIIVMENKESEKGIPCASGISVWGSTSDGENWNTQKKPPTCCKSLTNFIT